MHFSPSLQAFAMASALLLACPPSRGQSVVELMATGDAFERKFQDAEALKCYLPAEKLEPKNVRLLTRIAREYRHLMTDATSSQEKLRLGRTALAYGQKAAALGPNDSEAQLSPAISYGRMLPFQGRSEQVEALPRIKEAADKAIKIDPRNDLAWHVLGRWHQQVASISSIKRSLGEILYGKLPESTNADAIACFDKAIAINPRRLRHYIELGITYAQAEQYASARRFLVKGLAMPNAESDDPGVKIRGRAALAKLP